MANAEIWREALRRAVGKLLADNMALEQLLIQRLADVQERLAEVQEQREELRILQRQIEALDD